MTYKATFFIAPHPHLFTCALALLCTFLCAQAAYSIEQPPNSSTIIRYPGSFENERSRYTLELLAMALEKSPRDYTLLPNRIASPKTRNFKLLEKNQGIDVIWSMTNKERETRFLPVRIPIFKGLSGWRVSLVHKDNRQLLASTSTREELRKYTIGQMHAWTDAKILAHNRLLVDSGPNYESMFRMLAVKRFDIFPRSAIEALSEYKIYHKSGIEIEPNIVIHYPTAIYFFVNKLNAGLQKDIENGMEHVIASGKFNALFTRYFSESLYKVNLQHRSVIKLENPLLPDETPLLRSELWYSP